MVAGASNAESKRMSSHLNPDYPYTNADQETWRHFFVEAERLWNAHGGSLHPFYRDHIDALYSFRERIPTAREIHRVLKRIDWNVVFVDGYVASWEIPRMLARRVLPVSRSIRSRAEVFFSREPDIIHDLFGHLPTLLDPQYRALLEQWTTVAVRQPIQQIDQAHYHLNKVVASARDVEQDDIFEPLSHAAHAMAQYVSLNPSPALVMDKVYFWIFEFGLVQSSDGVQILGAGLLSSLSEAAKVAGGAVRTRRLKTSTVLAPYNISSQQDEYLVSVEFDDFERVIAEAARSLEPNALGHEWRYGVD